MCDPILVTLLKMRPHYSQSSGENATPSSGTFSLATYKEVPTTIPPPPSPTHTPRSFDQSSLVLFKGSKVELVCRNKAWVAEYRKYIRITGLHENLSPGDGFEET